MRVWGGQGYPNKHHEHFKVIFSITREEIELPVKIGDKNLNLTQPNKEVGQRQKEPDIHKPKVTMKCSFSLVEPSGLSPLSRRSYILVEQFGTSAFI